jgi:hypothetical protein
MMSNDSQDAPGRGMPMDRAGSIGPMIRRDGVAGSAPAPGDAGGRRGDPEGRVDGSARRWARLERAWWLGLVVTMGIFSAIPIVNMALGLATKDYGLWYQVGLAEQQGLDIYPRPETGRLFPFMYPPSAAAMLGLLSRLAPPGC